jgi:hypothetical protein
MHCTEHCSSTGARRIGKRTVQRAQNVNVRVRPAVTVGPAQQVGTTVNLRSATTGSARREKVMARFAPRRKEMARKVL